MRSIGNRGARSLGPIGCLVPGWITGGSGTGRSATILYQDRGMWVSSSTYLTLSITSLPPLDGVNRDLVNRDWAGFAPENRFPSHFGTAGLRLTVPSPCPFPRGEGDEVHVNF